MVRNAPEFKKITLFLCVDFFLILWYKTTSCKSCILFNLFIALDMHCTNNYLVVCFIIILLGSFIRMTGQMCLFACVALYQQIFAKFSHNGENYFCGISTFLGGFAVLRSRAEPRPLCMFNIECIIICAPNPCAMAVRARVNGI